MTEPNRRTILKVVAGLPILMSLGAAKHYFQAGKGLLSSTTVAELAPATAQTVGIASKPLVDMELTGLESASALQPLEMVVTHATINGVIVHIPGSETDSSSQQEEAASSFEV